MKYDIKLSNCCNFKYLKKINQKVRANLIVEQIKVEFTVAEITLENVNDTKLPSFWDPELG